MALLERRNNKRFYTKADDQIIVRMWNEGKSMADIAKELKRSVNSISYRIYRVLVKADSFKEIKYKD